MEIGLIFAALFSFIVRGLIWGFVSQTVNENKGYDGGFGWGFWLGLIGLIVVAIKPENISHSNYSAPSIPATSEQINIERGMLNSGWKCDKCGRYNPEYTTRCACGMAKAVNETNRRIADKKAKAPSPQQQELDNLRLVKEYKELLDAGAITEAEFEAKKKELLSL